MLPLIVLPLIVLRVITNIANRHQQPEAFKCQLASPNTKQKTFMDFASTFNSEAGSVSGQETTVRVERIYLYNYS